MLTSKRTTFLFASLSIAASLVGCGTRATDESRATGRSQLVIEARGADGERALTIPTPDGTCARIDQIAIPSPEELRELCDAGELPLPDALATEGCATGEAKSLTFHCYLAELPPIEPIGCVELEIADPNAILSPDLKPLLPLVPNATCAGAGLVPPPPPLASCAPTPIDPTVLPAPPITCCAPAI
jgi:hypothetical protein